MYADFNISLSGKLKTERCEFGRRGSQDFTDNCVREAIIYVSQGNGLLSSLSDQGR
jgi:hypothetical protein